MPIWRSTFFFQASSYGWSESFYLDAPDITTVRTASNVLSLKRILLCGRGIEMTAVRISDTALYRDYGIYPMTLNTDPSTGTTNDHVKPYDALLLHLTNGPYRNNLYLRGVPEYTYLGDDPLNIDPVFQNNFDAWLQALLDGAWKMKVQARFPPDVISSPLTDAVNSAPIIVTLLNQLSLAQNDFVVIRGVKGNTAANGTHQIATLVGSLITLKGTTGNGTYISGGVLRKSATLFVPIFNAYIIREVSRRTGRPFGSPVGRRRRKKTV